MKVSEDDIKLIANAILDNCDELVINDWDDYICPFCKNKIEHHKSSFDTAMIDIKHSVHCAYLISKDIIY